MIKEIKKAITVIVDFGKFTMPIEEVKEELASLAKTAKLEIVGEIIQNRDSPDTKYFIGEGKIDELKKLINETDASIVIFENELSGSKISNISNYLGVSVIDRSMLILDIFAGRAKSNEGKLQVELAQLKYNLPRLRAIVEVSDNFGGGVGMRGPGETKLETNRRTVEKEIQKKSSELKKLSDHRKLNRKQRISGRNSIVAIVGYTNSGKSSLLNLLSKEDVYVKDELFATLDTTTRKAWLGDGKEVIFIDTVGFINNLPHEFIEAFGSTLEECVYADLLVHVVDVSNPNYKNQMKITLDLLKELGSTAPIITVYNKIDKFETGFLMEDNSEDAVYVSIKEQTNIDKLKEIIKSKVKSSY